MNICLMTDVEYDPIPRRIKNLVDSNRQLANSEIGGEVSSRALGIGNKKVSYLFTKLGYIFVRYILKISG